MKYSLVFLPVLLLLQIVVSTLPPHIPRLAMQPKHILMCRNHQVSSPSFNQSNNVVVEHYYNQTLDHFNYAPQSYVTFQQRYWIDSRYWGGPQSNFPIFALLGHEGALDDIWDNIGFLSENAPAFKSLSVYIEHRFFGKSTPYGSLETAMGNATIRGYLNSAQALADYAEILLHIKHSFSAMYSPIIVIGGSYGGMLAAWFRLKYPHIAVGALAASAPILYFDSITPPYGFYSVLTKDFRDFSETCYKTIRSSWAEIDRVASQHNGLFVLSQRFNTCTPLGSSYELKNYLSGLWEDAAQNDYPPDYTDKIPIICNGINKPRKGTDIIGRIVVGLVSLRGNTCAPTSNEVSPFSSSKMQSTPDQWEWMTCSDIVMQIWNYGDKTSMLEPYPYSLADYMAYCENEFGVQPRPHWVTTFYGGHNIELTLKRFGSNIIFSNGLRDPFSVGGVLKNLSQTIVAVTTVKGKHCRDLQKLTKLNDPEWLITQRETEVKIFKEWLTLYYSDLKSC